MRDNFFFMREKHLMGPFKGFLRSWRLFWPLKMVPSVARGHFGAKKVESSSKTPRKGPIKCFSQIKKKLSQTCRISSSLVFLCTYGLHTDTKSSKTSQSHRKNPSKWPILYSRVPTVEAICKNLPNRYKKSARNPSYFV